MDAEPTTEALVRRARSGDREAAGEIARRYGERVRARIHGRIGGRLHVRADTEDVLQTTLMLALEDLRGFEWRGEEALVAWLATVAERQVLTEARRQRAGKRDVGRDQSLEAAEGLAAERTTPTEAAVRGELGEGLRAALEALPEAERRVVELHSYRGMGFDEVARTLDLPSRMAASRLFEKALRRLGEVLDPREDSRD